MSAVHAHHRKLRSHGGDDSYGNLIDLPMELHYLVHANPELAYQHGLLVKSYDDPAAIKPDVSGFAASVGFELEKPKRKNFEKGSEERRKRTRITVAVPMDTENGGEVWDETLHEVKRALVGLGLYESAERIPAYEAVIAALRDWLNDLVYVAD